MHSMLSTLCILVSIQNTLCTRYYVDSSASSGGSGLSWANALNTLDAALTLATRLTDHIWLRGGFTYIPSNPMDRTDCFITNNGLTIYGGFDGTETTINQRNPDNDPSILSGDIGTIHDATDNCYHVIQYTQQLTLDNVIIQHGNANYDGEYSSANKLNVLHRYGGALITTDVLRPTTLQLKSVIIRNNTAINGGALWFAASPKSPIQVVITDSEFIHNKAIDGQYEGGYGGAIYEMFLANITLISTKFTSNEAMYRGGAIYQDYGALLYAAGCTFEANKVNGWGGAIFSEDRNSQTDGTFPYLMSCAFDSNQAGLDGGAIFWYNGVIGTLQQNTFTSNTAQRNGNAIALINSESISIGNTVDAAATYNETLIEYHDVDDTLVFDIVSELNDLYLTPESVTDVHPFDSSDALCHVNADNTNINQDGSSWSNAYNDIQSCLDALRSTDGGGGEIWVASGTYTPTSIPEWKAKLGKTLNIHRSFDMYDNIRMYGGFAGTETSRSQRNWNDNPTYLSCQVTAKLQCNQIITAADDTVIDGFIFENAGRGNMARRRRLANSISVEMVLAAKPFNLGAGVLSNSTTIHVVNSIFHKLFSSSKGGAVYCIGMEGLSGITIKSPTFINVAFLGNRAAARGGAISADAQCNFVCNLCRFESNSCGGKGGAIYLDFDCDPSFTDTTFTSNDAMESGGCIAADGDSLSTFHGANHFTSNYARMDGGCLYSGSGVSMATQQGFVFTQESPQFANNYMFNSNIGHNDIYGWPYSIVEVITSAPTVPTSSTTSPPSSAQASNINIIVFTVDDLILTASWADVFAPNDGSVYLERVTPHIDAFMDESVLFANSLCASPMCSPSRFAVLTGRQPSRSEWAVSQTLSTSSGFLGTNVTIITSKIHFNDAIDNVPYVLQHDTHTPYYTGMVGKWHLMPSDGGLRTRCSTLNSVPNSDLYTQCTDLVKAQGFDFVDAWYHDNIVEDNGYFSHNPEWMVSQSQKFIDYAVNIEQKPFFLYFATTLTHEPSVKAALVDYSLVDSPKGTLTGDDIPSDTAMNTRSEIWSEASGWSETRPQRETDAARYWVDDCFGALIAYLKSNNLYDSTFIVFTSDQGMSPKAMLYEGGSRIVNMVRYPPLFSADTAPHVMPNELLVSNVDIAATIFELTGVTPPNEYKMDGVSWLNDVQNEINNNNAASGAQTCCHYRYVDIYNSHSIVSAEYQYIYRSNNLVDTTRTTTGVSFYPHLYDEEQLYHMASDPNQQTNQIDNVLLRSTVATFQELMRQYIEGSCPIQECKMPNVLYTSSPSLSSIAPSMVPSVSPTISADSAPSLSPISVISVCVYLMSCFYVMNL